MTDEIIEATPIWREALSNRDHELYEAAWTLFMDKMSVEAASQRLSDKKESIIPFLYSLIEDDNLHAKSALGKGNAPVNAISLLGEWQVVEALPRLFATVENSISSQPIYGAALNAIHHLGSEVTDEVLAWANDNPDLREEAAHILGHTAKGNAKAFDALVSWIQPDENGNNHIIEHIIDIDPNRAIEALYALSTNRNFSKEERASFREKQKDARKFLKEQRKEQVIEDAISE